MRERIFNNWTLNRAIYFILGIAVIIQSVIARQWIGAAFGGYFATMGIFAFGCASKNCFGGNCQIKPKHKTGTIEENATIDR